MMDLRWEMERAEVADLAAAMRRVCAISDFSGKGTAWLL